MHQHRVGTIMATLLLTACEGPQEPRVALDAAGLYPLIRVEDVAVPGRLPGGLYIRSASLNLSADQTYRNDFALNEPPSSPAYSWSTGTWTLDASGAGTLITSTGATTTFLRRGDTLLVEQPLGTFVYVR